MPLTLYAVYDFAENHQLNIKTTNTALLSSLNVTARSLCCYDRVRADSATPAYGSMRRVSTLNSIYAAGNNAMSMA